MLISKFDLYNPGWLEVVFENRNKEYGAYELRQHYASNMVRAMGLTFFGVAVVCGAAILFKGNPNTERMIPVEIRQTIPVLPPPVAPLKHVQPPAPVKAQQHVEAAPTIKFVVPVPTTAPVTDNPPKNDQITGNVGPQTTTGTPGAIDIPVTDAPPGAAGAPDVTIHDVGSLDKMPEPDGGMAGWAKFLNKNLRFPAEAQDAGVGGRVFLSFVIEKDGSLSNITVDKKAGYGFDEEAMRVLKLAKAWKPGVQNGQPVRVKYTIPINFQVSE